MKGNYIVLRDLNRPPKARSAASSGSAAGAALTNAIASTHESLGVSSVEMPPASGPSASVAAVAPKPSIDEVTGAEPAHIADLARDHQVVAVARAMPVAQVLPSDVAMPAGFDSGAGPTWGVSALGADHCPFNGRSAKVAILDSGIRRTHEAFPKDEINIIGQDFTGLGDIDDKLGHGTHCAATIAGRDVDGRRIGVAPGVSTLLVGRIFAPGVITTSQMLVNALQWALTNGANVISMSLNFDYETMVEQLRDAGLPPHAATAQALLEFGNNLRLFDSVMNMFKAQENFPGSQGAVVVGSAGNLSDRPTFAVPVAAPCNASSMLSVGALAKGTGMLDIAEFSNSMPSLVAPGVGILSADFSADDKLTFKSGTSMACPHIAGLAALWWDSVNLSGASPKASTVVARLMASCRTTGLNPALGPDDRGDGIPQAPN